MPYSALRSQLATTPAQPGVYRCASIHNGRPVWYLVGPSGTIETVHIVGEGEDEAPIAARLWRAFQGHQRPTLKLVKSAPASSRRRRTSVLGPDAMRGLFRRPALRPALLPPR